MHDHNLCIAVILDFYVDFVWDITVFITSCSCETSKLLMCMIQKKRGLGNAGNVQPLYVTENVNLSSRRTFLVRNLGM